ncbi:hypothetical protein ECG_02334 [Echinococcus granulosus]|nr:hypothetical protein ECG_02334 [Echinococcus granulosus]
MLITPFFRTNIPVDLPSSSSIPQLTHSTCLLHHVPIRSSFHDPFRHVCLILIHHVVQVVLLKSPQLNAAEGGMEEERWLRSRSVMQSEMHGCRKFTSGGQTLLFIPKRCSPQSLCASSRSGEIQYTFLLTEQVSVRAVEGGGVVVVTVKAQLKWLCAWWVSFIDVAAEAVSGVKRRGQGSRVNDCHGVNASHLVAFVDRGGIGGECMISALLSGTVDEGGVVHCHGGDGVGEALHRDEEMQLMRV